MSSLMHHGVKGQKWGVRRYQNKDGSYTQEGKEHRMYRDRTVRAGKTKSDVEDIISTMNKQDKERLALDGDEYLTYEQGSAVAKRILLKEKDTPVAFFDLLDDGDQLNVALGTRSGDEYRGKGYGSKAAKQGMDWYEKNKERFDNKPVIWGVKTDNSPSIKVAKKLGFEEDPNGLSDDGEWANYVKRYK